MVSGGYDLQQLCRIQFLVCRYNYQKIEQYKMLMSQISWAKKLALTAAVHNLKLDDPMIQGSSYCFR